MKEHTCNTYFVKSNFGSKESCVIQSNQDVHVCGCMVDVYMVTNLILLFSLKTYLSFGNWKNHFAIKHGLSYSSLFFLFLGGHLSTHCFQYLSDTCPFFQDFFSFFLFMNNFCIASCFFWLQQNFWDIATRIWSIYLVDTLFGIFLVFTPSVRVKHF